MICGFNPWSLLGLKRLTRGARDDASQARIGEAERLLLDRMCRAGGWNHGNSNMLGTELPPYVSTSALGLLAMQDLRDREPIAGTARYVQAHRVDEPSAMALGLTAIALGIYGIPVGDVTEALAAEWRRARFIGNLHVMALALYAPSLGYYANAGRKFGALPSSGSDFITAPELTPLFGRALARQLSQALEASGSDELFEFGAGSGALVYGTSL